MKNSIFKEYYSQKEFIDIYALSQNEGIEVIIPVYHTNELWRVNLFSIYKEIPVKRLLISDGGCIDDSIEIVKEFPRVEIFNHRNYKTLGKCITELIIQVQGEWFIYLHSDVYLPEGWYEQMIKYKDKYDWYGCPMNITVLVNYRLDRPERPYAGSQIGRKQAFIEGITKIDDDYVYRQEDFIFNKIVEDAGFKTGKVEDTFHYHQEMIRKTKGYEINVKSVSLITKTSPQEIQRANETQIRGIVKYLDPLENYIINDFKGHAYTMLKQGEINYFDFKKWIKVENDKWLPYFNHKLYLKVKWENLKLIIKKVLFK